MNPAGLYLHIPYCVKKCAYCDFVSVPTETGVSGAYCSALKKEIVLTAAMLPKREYGSIFFGGGTPSLLTGEQMGEILSTLRQQFSILPNAEISMECNPGTVTEEKLAAFRAAGVNRISVGLQSADDTLLRSIGRIHDYAAFCDTVRALRRVGFDNFNVDVMHGLPMQTQEQYLDTLKKVADSGAVHISAYGLILEEGTPLHCAVTAGETVLPDEDAVADMQDAGIDLLASLGYRRYEISNFAKAGFACRHNLNYWANGEYVGLGPAAHSAMRLSAWTRWSNTDSLHTYLSCLERDALPRDWTETPDRAEEMFETVMVGLRTLHGVSFVSFSARFGASILDVYSAPIAALRKNDWLDETAYADGRLALNKRGLDLQNSALELFLI